MRLPAISASVRSAISVASFATFLLAMFLPLSASTIVTVTSAGAPCLVTTTTLPMISGSANSAVSTSASGTGSPQLLSSHQYITHSDEIRIGSPCENGASSGSNAAHCMLGGGGGGAPESADPDPMSALDSGVPK